MSLNGAPKCSACGNPAVVMCSSCFNNVVCYCEVCDSKYHPSDYELEDHRQSYIQEGQGLPAMLEPPPPPRIRSAPASRSGPRVCPSGYTPSNSSTTFLCRRTPKRPSTPPPLPPKLGSPYASRAGPFATIPNTKKTPLSGNNQCPIHSGYEPPPTQELSPGNEPPPIPPKLGSPCASRAGPFSTMPNTKKTPLSENNQCPIYSGYERPPTPFSEYGPPPIPPKLGSPCASRAGPFSTMPNTKKIPLSENNQCPIDSGYEPTPTPFAEYGPPPIPPKLGSPRAGLFRKRSLTVIGYPSELTTTISASGYMDMSYKRTQTNRCPCCSRILPVPQNLGSPSTSRVRPPTESDYVPYMPPCSMANRPLPPIPPGSSSQTSTEVSSATGCSPPAEDARGAKCLECGARAKVECFSCYSTPRLYCQACFVYYHPPGYKYTANHVTETLY